uniref:Uncharacterized protein n=1 Tax=Anguilla anguilla TaxID=7936 RepID=A0A0E9SB80_ANGAN
MECMLKVQGHKVFMGAIHCKCTISTVDLSRGTQSLVH